MNEVFPKHDLGLIEDGRMIACGPSAQESSAAWILRVVSHAVTYNVCIDLSSPLSLSRPVQYQTYLWYQTALLGGTCTFKFLYSFNILPPTPKPQISPISLLNGNHWETLEASNFMPERQFFWGLFASRIPWSFKNSIWGLLDFWIGGLGSSQKICPTLSNHIHGGSQQSSLHIDYNASRHCFAPFFARWFQRFLPSGCSNQVQKALPYPSA